MQNDEKIYDINVQEPYFTYIKNGIKRVEGRLNKSKFQEMQAGDKILLNGEITLQIMQKTVYKTFREMINFEGIKNTVPDATSLDEAEGVYYKFFSKADEASFGVSAIEVKLI